MARRSAGLPGVRPLALALLLAGFAGLGLAAGAAHGETGAPVLEQDGVWRARGDWEVGAGETVSHEGEEIALLGNVSLASGAVLEFTNCSISSSGESWVFRRFEANAAARLRFTNTSLVADASLTFFLEDAALEARRASFRFEGTGSGAPGGLTISIDINWGSADLVDSEVFSDDDRVFFAFESAVHLERIEFKNLTGAPAEIGLRNGAAQELDTTLFSRLHLTATDFTLYSTVRFLLESASGEPASGHLNGSAPYGTVFAFDTGPPEPAPLRVVWLRGSNVTGEIESGTTAGPKPLTFTAFNATLGGTSSAAAIVQARQDLAVRLSATDDLAVSALRVEGRALEGPSLKRAYYLEYGRNGSIFVEVENRGVAASMPAALALTRTPLDPSSWQPTGPPAALGTLEVPPLEPGQRWNATVTLPADAFGGNETTTSPCTTQTTFTGLVAAEVRRPQGGDFATYNDARAFTAITFSVEELPGNPCLQRNDTGLVGLAALALASAGAAVWVSHHFSERRLAARAARSPEKKPELREER